MHIRPLGYDSESDELDLLIDVEAPVAAEAIPLDAGIYIRCEPASGRVVGAFVRGYSHLIRRLHAGEPVPMDKAKAAGLVEVFEGVVTWLTEAEKLSGQLIKHLGAPPEQRELVESLLELHATVTSAA